VLFRSAQLHCVVQIHTVDAAARDKLGGELVALAADCGVSELIPREDGTRLDGNTLGPSRRLVHFGYTDGIARPDVVWDGGPVRDGQVSFRHFVLGYSDETCWSAPGPRAAAAELVRGSSYGAFCWIYQDVATFNRFLRDNGPLMFPELSPPAAEELLAAKLLGRWRDGTPLVVPRDRPDAATDNTFDYASDAEGRACPFSAHVRVMNPRGDALRPVVVEGVPSVLRRGTPYGKVLEGVEDDGCDRGLIGVFLCSDIRRQIYTLTGWGQRTDFAESSRGADRRQDALIGNRVAPADNRFVAPGAAAAPTLPAFVRIKGAALLLYPGRSTLQALSA